MKLVIGIVVGVAIGLAMPLARADSGVIDRALVERLVRAVESNARATEALARCKH